MSMQFEDFGSSDGSLSPSAGPADEKQPMDDVLKSSTRLQYLLANTPAIIYSSVPTGDGTMTYVSDNAERLLGYTPHDMVADPSFWFDHLHPDDVNGIFSSLALLFSQGHRTYEYRFRVRDGRYLWMHDSLRLIRDAQGNALEVIGALTDITDRKQMEESLQKKGEEQQLLINQLRDAQAQLLQSEKMASIGQLAAGIAHEINNPVGFVNSNMGTLGNYVETLCNVIEGYDKALGDMADRPEAQSVIAELKQRADFEFLREDVTDLVRESLDGLKRVRDIVQSLKDFAHIGESDWQFSDLHAGMDSTLNLLASEINTKANVVKSYGEIPEVECIPSELNQVFMSLLLNAIQAIAQDERGEVAVRTGAAGGSVWIEIADNGVGIAAENLPRIFDPFFTTKPVGKGAGLGLSRSYGIIQKHNGHFDVQTKEGRGTTFRVTLPLVQSTRVI